MSPSPRQLNGYFSVSHNDRDFANEFKRRLEHELRLRTGAEINLWEPDGLFPVEVDAIKDAIDEAVRRSDFFIAIITPSYMNSIQCRYELASVFDRRPDVSRIFAIGYLTLDGMDWNLLPVPLRELNFYDWQSVAGDSTKSAELIERLSKDITRTYGRKPSGEQQALEPDSEGPILDMPSFSEFMPSFSGLRKIEDSFASAKEEIFDTHERRRREAEAIGIAKREAAREEHRLAEERNRLEENEHRFKRHVEEEHRRLEEERGRLTEEINRLEGVKHAIAEEIRRLEIETHKLAKLDHAELSPPASPVLDLRSVKDELFPAETPVRHAFDYALDSREEAKNDPVEFAVSHPGGFQKNAPFVVDAWVYQKKDRDPAMQRAVQLGYSKDDFRSSGAASVDRGTTLTVRLEIESWAVTPLEQTCVWTGESTNLSFSVMPSASIQGERAIGICSFSISGLRIGQVVFHIPNSSAKVDEGKMTTALAYKKAFASYASKDRSKVLARVQGIEMAGIEVFMDVRDLKSNEPYPNRLLGQIEQSDVLYLFWSRHAKESKWVDHEWRYGMSKKGVDFINPVPLVDPRKVAPPPELVQEKHFNDWTLIYIEYERSLNIWSRVGAWLRGD